MRGLLELAANSSPRLSPVQLLHLATNQAYLQSTIRSQSGTRAAGRLADLARMDLDEFDKAVQFLVTHLEVLNNTSLLAVTSVRAKPALGRLLAPGPKLAVIDAPLSDGSLAAGVSSLFMALLVQRVTRTFGGRGQPILLVLDEAARLQDRVDLAALLSVGAGAGLSVLLSVQDITQFREEKREEIVTNCGTIVALPGSGAGTTEQLLRRLGTRRRSTIGRSLNVGAGQGASQSYTYASEVVPVLGHAELSSPPGAYGATVLSQSVSSKPVLTDLARPDLL